MFLDQKSKSPKSPTFAGECASIQNKVLSSLGDGSPHNLGKALDRGWCGVGVEGLTLDFGPVEKIHRWKEMPSCDEFVGYKRSKHTIVGYKDDLYIFGGDNGKSMLNDLLRFDVKEKSWGRAFTTGSPPAPRYHHSAIEFQGSMFVFGGYTGDIHSNSNLTNKNDLHEYRFATCQWIEWKFESRKPVARAAHGAATYDNKLWIFAGYDGNARLNDMWTTSLSSNSRAVHCWEEVNQSGAIPPTCCNFALAVARDKMFVFSGQSGAQITNDLFQFDFSTKFWTRLSTDHIVRASQRPPDKRYGHIMVTHDRHLYVFGGASGNILPKGIHCFDLDEQMWLNIEIAEDSEVPSGRLFHAAAVIKDAMYIFGGTVDYNVRSGEMHRFQFSTLPRCTLRDDYEQLLNSEQFCDVVFLVGENKEEVPAHIAIICARSEVLKNHILEAKNIPEEPIESIPSLNDESSLISQCSRSLLRVNLPDADPRSFRLVLSYIYTDKVQPSARGEDPSSNSVILVMMDLYKLAYQFQLIRLEHLCLQFLQNFIKMENVLTALQSAAALKLDYIKDYCLRFIVKDASFKSIVMSEHFEKVDQPLMVDIIRLRELCQSRHQVDMMSQVFDVHKCNTLEQDMEKFLKESGKMFSDIVLCLGELEFKGHKAILAARTAYFEALFRSFSPPNDLVQLALGELTPTSEAFMSLMRFIYHGEIFMPPEHSLYLFSDSNFYSFTNNRLQAYCKYNLEMNVNQMNVIQILEAADRIQAIEMKGRALDIIVSNFTKVAKQPEMSTLSKNLLLEIIRSVAEKMETKVLDVTPPV